MRERGMERSTTEERRRAKRLSSSNTVLSLKHTTADSKKREREKWERETGMREISCISRNL